jgi:hypothetical protein
MFNEGGLVFLAFLGAYLVVAVLLDFHYLTFDGDAASRMANAFYVLYSRDPHLAAVGFVWNPGMSIADLIPLLFYHAWTPLATHIFAASIVSAVSMAGAVYQVRCVLLEWGVARAPRITLTVLFALNPMIVYHGGNGMSEGLYLFTMVASCRYLLRWLRDNDLASLVYAGVSLGLCYLVRNEAAGAAMFAGAAVLVVAFFRNTATNRSRRIWGALTDLTIFEIPFILAFSGWAIASYVITGQPFEQFTSIYGNASQEQFLSHDKLRARLDIDLHVVLYFSPLIAVVLAISLVLAFRRRDVGILAPLSVIGGGLAFDLLGYAANSIQPFFRYFITAVPLEILLVGSFFAAAPALIGGGRSASAAVPRWSWMSQALASVLGLALLIPSIPTTIIGMQNPTVGVETREFLGFIFDKHQTRQDQLSRIQYRSMLAISGYLADKHLADGQVIVDNFNTCIPLIIAMSPNPDIFVIPNDRDFQKVLADPLTFHAHYILDAAPTGAGSLTAPNILYPQLWATGGGFTKDVHKFPASGLCSAFKLLRVTAHPNQQG